MKNVLFAILSLVILASCSNTTTEETVETTVVDTNQVETVVVDTINVDAIVAPETEEITE